MSEYVYKNPLNNGYKKFKLSRKQHNQLFQYRQIKWYDKYEYYYNDHEILLHKFSNVLGIVVATILFPADVLFQGLFNIKECCDELISLYNQKKYGSYIPDCISKGSPMYTEIMEIINKKG